MPKNCPNGWRRAPAGRHYVAAANQYLFAELGFTGNAGDYYDPRNSCLNDVLTARTGIPITLAVVYLEIARQAGAAGRRHRTARAFSGAIPGRGVHGVHRCVRGREHAFAGGVLRVGPAIHGRYAARRSRHARAGKRPPDRDAHAAQFARRLRSPAGLWQGSSDSGSVTGGGPTEARNTSCAARSTCSWEIRRRHATTWRLICAWRPRRKTAAEVEQRLRALRGYQARLN